MLDRTSYMSSISENRFVSINGRTLAYRSIGQGQPLLLCVRFRGNMDSWDPAFLDALADHGFEVIVFDYTGLGLSSGTPTYNPIEMAKDPRDLIEALGLENVVIGGWSLGGIAAQALISMHPANISHCILIGTNPPGQPVKSAEQIFYDTAGKSENDAEDNVILFFEPKSASSRLASERSLSRLALRTKDRSNDIPIDFARQNLGTGPRPVPFPAPSILETIKSTPLPILHVGGDHDIIFPVENWYALNEQAKSVHLVTFPQAGHGPHHQFPEISADIIASFIQNT